jgi:hypothetical protein
MLRPFGIFSGPLVNFVVISYISSRFGMFYQEKSGNPAEEDVEFRHYVCSNVGFQITNRQNVGTTAICRPRICRPRIRRPRIRRLPIRRPRIRRPPQSVAGF